MHKINVKIMSIKCIYYCEMEIVATEQLHKKYSNKCECWHLYSAQVLLKYQHIFAIQLSEMAKDLSFSVEANLSPLNLFCI